MAGDFAGDFARHPGADSVKTGVMNSNSTTPAKACPQNWRLDATEGRAFHGIMNANLTSKLALAALLAFATTSMHAGTITVVTLPTTGTDAASGISTNNTYVCCLDFGTNATPPVTINGVNFQRLDPGNQTVNTVTGTETNHGGTYTLTSGGTSACKLARTGSGTPTGQADGNTWKLMYDLIYVGSSAPVNSWLNQDYGGLTNGQNYTLRIYYRQWAADTRSINVFFNGEGTSQAYGSNPLNEDAGGAHYIEYDFTAASTDVFVYMTNTIGNESAMIYGMSLQWVPPIMAPTISAQPVSFTNWAGISNSLSVVAAGNPAPTYQWYQNSLPLSGATNAVLSFSPLNPTNAGTYYVLVQNTTNLVLNSVQSSNAVVGVLVGTNVISPTLSQVQLPATGTDAATGIGTGSNYLCVLDFGAAAFSGQVNGVTFTPVNLLTTPTGADPNYGGTWSASTTDANGFKAVAGGGLGGQADGNMASVLTGANYLGLAPINTTATLNLGGLALGAQYELRYYYKQWTVDSPLRIVQFTFNGDGTNATFQTDEDNGGAYYLNYDFTAAGGTVSLLLTDESSQANYGPMIYAITLQQTAAAPPAPVAPSISAQPVGFTNWAGSSGSLSVSASGSPAPAYQWYQNSSPLAGATSAVLSFSPLDPTNAGSYYVAITNVAGMTNSSVVSVGVLSGTNVISPTLSQVQLPATGTDAATGIGTGSGYLCVLDFGQSAAQVAVGGIMFTPVNLASGTTNQSGVDPNYGGTWTATTTDAAGFRDVAGGGASVTAQADGSMVYVLTGASYVSVAPMATSVAFDFGGLAPSAQYSLCYYYRQWTAGDSPTRPIQFTFNGDTSTNGTCTVDEDAGGAYCIAYAFTAAGTNVSLVLNDESAVVNEGPMLYAITLQQTAPPVVLNYSLSGTSLTLFWNASLTNYVLETATQLPATSWTPVPGVVNNSVTVNASTGMGFFRLQQSQ
jgi:hypothetical protein